MRGEITAIQQHGADLVLSLSTKPEGRLRWSNTALSYIYIAHFSYQPQVGQLIQLVGNTLIIEGGEEVSARHCYQRDYHSTFKENFGPD